MNPSRARKKESRGKSAKLVLAARARMSAVVTCMKNRIQPLPTIWRVISDRTVCTSLGSGRTRIWLARKLMPRKRLPKMITCAIRVARAFFHSGFLNAGTPSDTASTPVRPAAPELKARRIRKSERPPMPAAAASQCAPHAAGAWKTARL